MDIKPTVLVVEGAILALGTWYKHICVTKDCNCYVICINQKPLPVLL